MHAVHTLDSTYATPKVDCYDDCVLYERRDTEREGSAKGLAVG